MSGYIGTQPVPQSTQTRQTFTATASQTSFATGGYQAGYLDVFLNGVKLVDGTDYTATNGSDVVLTTGAASGDTLEVVAYTAFTVANVTGAGGDFTVDGNLLVGTATSPSSIKVGQVLAEADGRYAQWSSTLGGGWMGSNGGAGGLGQLEFGTHSGAVGSETYTEYMRIDSSGHVIIPSGVTLGAGGLVYSAANTLDDYEEGTWTPSFNTGSFANIQNFTYTKIGRLVHLTGYLATPSGLPSGGNLIIGGLPFPASASFNMAPLWYDGSSSVIAMGYMGGGDYTLNVRPVGGFPSTFTELSVQMVYTTTA